MADGTITVEVSTQAVRTELERLREELACVRQALPEMWRDSEPSVAVATLAAENEALKREAHTWSKAAEHYAKDAERWHGELQRDAFDQLRMRIALTRLWPALERAMSGLVFTADRAGEVQADMNTLRAHIKTPNGSVEPGTTVRRWDSARTRG